MADNYLITGYHGTPHVTAENDRGIYAGIFGAGRFVLPVGEQFRAEYIGNNTVRMYDGKLIDNGAAAGIPAGRYIDLTISEAGQGKNRNDLIVFQYEKNTSTLVESGTFVVVKGTETTGTAAVPALKQADLLSDSATLDQMALYRVPVSGANISGPVQMFEVLDNLQKIFDKAPINHASSTTTYGVSSAANYGHAKASATTPKAPGTASIGTETGTFARGDHVHPEQVAAHGVTTAGTGAAYTATVEGITALSVGSSFIMIPHTASTTAIPTLNVNGLGAKAIRRGVLDNSITTVASTIPDWLGMNKPVRVTYNGLYWVADLPRLNITEIMDELINLYIWKKFEEEPKLVETSLSGTDKYISWNGTTVVYASEMTFNDGVISLVNPVTLNNPTEDDLAVVKGKYIYSHYANNYYFIPSNATIGDTKVTLGSGTIYPVYATPMTQITATGNKVGLVASKQSDTYPASGEHTDGYWYEYLKQLGE